MQLTGQIALITGGSRGIGRATALAFAKEGADIAFCHLDDDPKANETAAEITALGRRALHRSLDVADIAAGKKFATHIEQTFGSIDILFNNAGIIIVASQRGLKGAVNSAPYSAAKAAIIGFTRSLSWEAAPKGVRVNAIAPGPIDTDLTATMSPEDRKAFIAALPAGRFGRPEEIAATALLLAGPQGGFYVGACLSPNGGDVMH